MLQNRNFLYLLILTLLSSFAFEEESRAAEEKIKEEIKIILFVFESASKGDIESLKKELEERQIKIIDDYSAYINYMLLSIKQERSLVETCNALKKDFPKTIEICEGDQENDINQDFSSTVEDSCKIDKEVTEYLKKKEKCLLISSNRPKDFPEDLSPYWAQKRIGTDFAKKTIPNELLDSDISAVAYDNGKHHGRMVSGLIADDSQISASPGKATTVDASKSSKMLSALALSIKNKNIPHIINHSMSMSSSESGKKVAKIIKKTVKENDLIFVTSAGNDYPDISSPIKQSLAKSSSAIVVGSLSPTGHPSSFSEEYPEVTISAPANNQVLSREKRGGEHEQFGGTSAASPLVAGCIRTSEIILEGHLGPKTAKKLLIKTAIPTLSSLNKKENSNGAGMVNCYKMALVSRRIREKCLKSEKKLSKKCVKSQVRRGNNYRFDDYKKIDLAYKMGNELFLEYVHDRKKMSCQEKKQAFSFLRQQSLIHPYNSDLHRLLGKIYYMHGGAEIDGDYHLELARAIDKSPSLYEAKPEPFSYDIPSRIRRFKKYHEPNRLRGKGKRRRYIRYNSLYSSFERAYSKKTADKVFNDLAKSSVKKDRELAASIAPATPAGKAMLRVLSSDNSSRIVRIASVRRTLLFYPVEIESLKRFSKDSDFTVRSSFMKHFTLILDNKLTKAEIKFLKKLLKEMKNDERNDGYKTLKKRIDENIETLNDYDDAGEKWWDQKPS